jgi:hypothetical protein
MSWTVGSDYLLTRPGKDPMVVVLERKVAGTTSCVVARKGYDSREVLHSSIKPNWDKADVLMVGRRQLTPIEPAAHE